MTGPTEIKKQGQLIFSSYSLFQLLCEVELAFLSLVKRDMVFVRDAFEATLTILAAKKLPFVGCPEHQKYLMVSVIFQYLTLGVYPRAQCTEN